jgi:hypothetical protein
MKAPTRLGMAGIVCLTTSLAFALAPIPALSQSKQNVTVVNPVTNPVNVRGTVDVGNSVVPVEVSNADPIPVSLGQPEVIQEQCQGTAFNGDRNAGCQIYIVPAGKRLVIEYVSATVSPEFDSIDHIQIAITPVGGGLIRFLHQLVGVTYPSGNYVVSQPIKMAVNTGERVSVGFTRTDTTSTKSMVFHVSGSLIDSP